MIVVRNSLKSNWSRPAQVKPSLARSLLGKPAVAPGASLEPVTTDQLTLMIRRQINAEGKTQLTDDILVAANQQKGSSEGGSVPLGANRTVSVEG